MDDETLTHEMLAAFDRDPIAALAEHPRKFDASGSPVEREGAFAPNLVEGGRFVGARDQIRRRLHTVVDGALISLRDVLPGRAPFEGNDRAENLVDELRHIRLDEMEGLREAALAETPWTDDYWAIYLGILGRRYADPRFPGSTDWQENYAYVQGRPAAAIAASGDAQAIDRLSPSEKYDLLVGDPAGGLTARMWDEGRGYYEASGEVETWMGICHGWAPASYMLPRPRRVVEAIAANGARLRFYPADIKALASLLWANTTTTTRFIGSRSDDRSPAVDEAGRLTSTRCFDTNPGTWHLAIVNQIGACRRSFVMDATYDYEVWNQPIAGYRYSLFNPQTRRYVSTLADARVSIDDFSRDHFRRHRSGAAAAVVGVMMQARYVVEASPTQATSDSPASDRVREVRYLYDLELDREGRILGGEWYQNKHPDFLWTPPPRARARTPGDAYALGTWSCDQPVPEAWRRAAWRVSSSPSGAAPLARIVEGLIAAADA